MRRFLITTIAAGTTALTLLATAGAAHADSWSHRDARGDVMRMSTADDGEAVKDPADKATDITRISVNHGPGKVTVTLKVRDVQRGDTGVISRLVTPEGDYEVMAIRTADLRVFTIADETAENDVTDVRCRGKKVAFDTKRDRIRLTIPRVCLGSPRWVRAGAGLIRGDLMALDDNMTMDEALRRGSKRSVTGPDTLKVGKKVRVG